MSNGLRSIKRPFRQRPLSASLGTTTELQTTSEFKILKMICTLVSVDVFKDLRLFLCAQNTFFLYYYLQIYKYALSIFPLLRLSMQPP